MEKTSEAAWIKKTMLRQISLCEETTTDGSYIKPKDLAALTDAMAHAADVVLQCESFEMLVAADAKMNDVKARFDSSMKNLEEKLKVDAEKSTSSVSSRKYDPTCPVCMAHMINGDDFCPKCGRKLKNNPIINTQASIWGTATPLPNNVPPMSTNDFTTKTLGKDENNDSM